MVQLQEIQGLQLECRTEETNQTKTKPNVAPSVPDQFNKIRPTSGIMYVLYNDAFGALEINLTKNSINKGRNCTKSGISDHRTKESDLIGGTG